MDDNDFLTSMGIDPCFDNPIPHEWTEIDIATVSEQGIAVILRSATGTLDKAEKAIRRLDFEVCCWRNFALVGWAALVYELWRIARW